MAGRDEGRWLKITYEMCCTRQSHCMGFSIEVISLIAGRAQCVTFLSTSNVFPPQKKNTLLLDRFLQAPVCLQIKQISPRD